MISAGPLENESVALISRDSIRPMKNVKASSRTTPMLLFLVFSMPYMKPNATAKKIRIERPGLPAISVKPEATPIHAPSTVGIIERASSQ
ncbi:hypothetical protein D3C86_1525560 [compost metagenome]